ncbi:MAG TPA: hypothetical protein VE687_02830 [Stellaceae bacterium]|nr:hypothetical protein [Stellaceae bacterium]
MIESLTREQYDTVLRHDFVTFAARCFHDLNPQAELARRLDRIVGLEDGRLKPFD